MTTEITVQASEIGFIVVGQDEYAALPAGERGGYLPADVTITLNRTPRSQQEWKEVGEWVAANFPVSADDLSHGFSSASGRYTFFDDADSTPDTTKRARRAPRYYVMEISLWANDTWKPVSEHATRAEAEAEASRREHNGVRDNGSTDSTLVRRTMVKTYTQLKREFGFNDDDIMDHLNAEFEFQQMQVLLQEEVDELNELM